ncbi:MAG: MFS transporter [Endozoicomonas sp.]
MSKNTLGFSSLKTLFIICIGGMLEAYDFIIYGLMITYISPLFFPGEEIQQSLIMAFSIFAVAYISRPLGGCIFGHQGDRYGRKKPLTSTLLLMAAATVAIGLLPDYKNLGLWAPILLFSFRFVQGLSMGGEAGGIYTYVSEVFEHKKGLAIAFIASSMELGILLGHGIHSFLIRVLGKQAMNAFGWRIPFIFGGILGLVGYIIRRKSLESPAFVRIKNQNQIAGLPVRELAQYPRHCLCGTLLITMLSMTFLTFLIYIPTTLVVVGHPDGTPATGCYIVVATVLSNLILAFWLDTQSDKLMQLAIISLLILGVPINWLIFNSTVNIVPLILLCGLLTSLSSMTSLFLLTSLFPTPVRYSGISIVYGLGFAIGGTTPAVTTWLSYQLSQPWASGYLLAIAGIFGFWAYMVLRTLDQRFVND